LFGTLKVHSFILTEVSDCGLLIVVTSSTFLKRKDMLKEKNSQRRSTNLAAQHMYWQMYFVHIYGIHVYCALVDLDSSDSPGVHSTLGLTSSTQPYTRMHVSRNTCDTRACSREIGEYKQTKCAYTSAYVHPHACVYKYICIHIHRHTYIHIHTYTHAHIHSYMQTHINVHAYAHLYTDRNPQ